MTAPPGTAAPGPPGRLGHPDQGRGGRKAVVSGDEAPSGGHHRVAWHSS